MSVTPASFVIAPHSGVPLYRQIVDQVHAMIAVGRLQPGDLLPSTRALSSGLEINLMTVSKAYTRLETDGIVERVRGIGMRVLPTSDRAVPTVDQLIESLRPPVHQAKAAGLTDAQIRKLVREILQELSQ